MSFKSFFSGLFGGIGAIGKCLGSWNTSVTIFRQNKFPIFTKNWWKAGFKEKWELLESWWNSLGCLQSIMYVIAGVIFMVVAGGFLFIGSDFILDFEDLGIFVEGFGSLITGLASFIVGIIQVFFDWTIYLAEFFFLTINPAYHLIQAAASSLDFSPLATYVLVGEMSLITFMIVYKYLYIHYIYNAASRHPKQAKIYKLLSYPLKLVLKAVREIFGKYVAEAFNIALLPARFLIVIVGTVLGNIF